MTLATMSSQTPIIQKATIKGQNGFIANEVVMDSIMEVHYAFLSELSKSAQLKIQLKQSQIDVEKLMLKVDFLETKTANLELQKNELHTQLDIKDKKNENDIMYWKAKAKGKFRSFLYGTGLGALVVAIITLL
jgi:hypothetical protein